MREILAPRRPVVHQHPVGQAVATECRCQCRHHAAATLVGAGRKNDAVARMIVHHRQRVAAPTPCKRKMALEIHLPQLVRRCLLEALIGPPLLRLLGRNQTVPMQDARNRARLRRNYATQPQRVMDLASAPRRMLAPHPQNRCLQIGWRRRRRVSRTPRALLDIAPSSPPQPLVPRRRTDPERPARRPNVRTLHTCCRHKSLALLPHGHSSKRHPTSPDRDTRMPISMCPLCLRTPVHYVFGQHNKLTTGSLVDARRPPSLPASLSYRFVYGDELHAIGKGGFHLH